MCRQKKLRIHVLAEANLQTRAIVRPGVEYRSSCVRIEKLSWHCAITLLSSSSSSPAFSLLLPSPFDDTLAVGDRSTTSASPAMSSPQSAVRQRGPKDSSKKRPLTPNGDGTTSMNGKLDDTLNAVKDVTKETVQKDWDHKIAFTLLTILGFLTRFWGISHPNQVVFDEVHFGKVGYNIFHETIWHRN